MVAEIISVRANSLPKKITLGKRPRVGLFGERNIFGVYNR